MKFIFGFVGVLFFSFGAFATATLVQMTGGAHMKVVSIQNALEMTVQVIQPAYGEQLSVTLQSDQAAYYLTPVCSSLLALDVGRVALRSVMPLNYSVNIPNQPLSAGWKWADICKGMTGDSSCRRSGTATIRIGFSEGCHPQSLVDYMTVHIFLN